MTATIDHDHDPDPSPGLGPDLRKAAPGVRSRRGVRELLVRLHFYAGVFVAPFLVVAALTGLVYALTPQLDQLVYGDRLSVERTGGPTVPLSGQIAAARAAYPEGVLASVATPAEPDGTTRVVLDVPGPGERQRTVFVDPYTGEVRGALATRSGATPLTAWLGDLHRDLRLGETGRLYSEAAASWLWVLVAGGLVLWLGRARGRRAASVRGALLPERTARGVRRTRGLHAATGVWLALGLLFLSATGLTWSQYSGERFGRLVDAVQGDAPKLDTRLPGAAPASGAEGGEHAGHGGDGATADAAEPAEPGPAAFDTALATARRAGLDGPVVLTPPADASAAWVVAQKDDVWPVRYDRVAVHPVTGEVTARTRWADHPPLAKLSKLGVQGHMGVLFGVANQVVLVVVALGLVLVVLWGYRMWWQRRPTRGDRAARLGRVPARGAWRRVPLPVLVAGVPAVAAVGWALPVLGCTLLLFLVVDAVAGLVAGRAR
ncbi:PepSY-associated TM helix domain-containing protein [Streptomyces filamentosus]|uniref:PepSY-associated TM helix domain-containing protein n=1 Tax=Streptomyces filamentosus TaxID=67294 RepID=UPI00381FAA04